MSSAVTNTHSDLKHAPGSPSRNILRKHNKAPVKKQGGGGKGVWHDAGMKPEEGVQTVDSKDPNYDSEEDDPNAIVFDEVVYGDTDQRRGLAPTVTLADFKVEVVAALTEYWMSEDCGEVARRVAELASPIFNYELVKRCVTLSMERGDRERELASRLLSGLYSTTLTVQDVGRGFERLFEVVDDLEIDVPKARLYLSNFVARAVVDELLPPAFLTDPVVRRIGGVIVEDAQRHLSIKHAIPRIEKVWGPGDGRPVEELKQAVDQLLQEFLSSGDSGEAVTCVKELNVPHFHHEVVKRAVVNCMDEKEEQQIAMSGLVCQLHSELTVTGEQVEHGFARLYGLLPDLTLDTPCARSILDAFRDRAIAGGCLPADWQPPTSEEQ